MILTFGIITKSGTAAIVYSDEDIFFNSLSKKLAPVEWIKFAHSKGLNNVWLVKDSRLTRSIRRIKEKEIFVNIDETYWRNYAGPPIYAKSPEESIVMKFLHEVGHFVSAHSGTEGLVVDKLGISRDFETKVTQQSFFSKMSDSRESEAWQYAISIRDNQKELFKNLLDSYKLMSIK